MGYENDPYMDEDGEPLMDPDMPSDAEPNHVIDDYADDGDDWQRRERSLTPVMGSMEEDKGGKMRKRLVKKTERESPPVFADEGLDNWNDEESSSKKKKSKITPFMKEGNTNNLCCICLVSGERNTN